MSKEKEKMFKDYKDTYCSGYMNRYTCEFDFLPNVLPPLYKEGKIDDYVMTHPSEWKKILLKKGVRSDFGIDKLIIEKEESKDDNIKFVYIFPKPEDTPECFYAITIFDKKKDWKYYTLELDYASNLLFKDGKGGAVCGQKAEMHLNYGKFCPADLGKFKETIQDLQDGKSNGPGLFLGSFDGKNNQRQVVGLNPEQFNGGLNPEQLNGQCILF